MGWSACGARNWTTSRKRGSRRKLAELRLLAVGRIGHGPEAALFARYNDRLRPKFTVTEYAEARGSPAEMRRREAAALLGGLPEAGLVVALDLGGTARSSEGFAALLSRWEQMGRPLCFVIGGAEGLDGSMLDRADYVLSLGPLTWPHLLARVMLAEQVFRARTIAAGHPYHRGGRTC
jgi:23S rRNA (pseudouridine1915-N3)-methyltransferase